MTARHSSPSSQTSVFYRNINHTYPVAVRSEGVYIYDADGKRYLDASGGAVVVSIGHGVKEITEAAVSQMNQLTYAHSSQFTNPHQEELAQLMADLSPGGNYHLISLTGGSEAVEAAIKVARQYHIERGNTSKHLVIGRQQSYHGSTLGALSVTGYHSRRQKFLPMLLPFDLIEPCNCYQCPFGKTYPECGLECATSLEASIQRLGPENVAAFIAETLVGTAAGAPVPPLEYFQMIREICDRYDILFIADEVMCGMGRTGKTFAIEHWGIKPDLIATGKGMASGYAPLSGLLVSDHMYRVFKEGSGMLSNGQTFMGNPHSSAVGVAVLNYIQKHDLIGRCAEMGKVLFSELERVQSHPLVGDVRGLGLFAGIELVQDSVTRKPFPRSFRVVERVTEEAFRRGLILYPGSGGANTEEGDHLLIAPPFVITEEEIKEVVSLLKETLDTVHAELESSFAPLQVVSAS